MSIINTLKEEKDINRHPGRNRVKMDVDGVMWVPGWAQEDAQEKILLRDSEDRSLMMTLHFAVWKVWTRDVQEHKYPLLGGPGLWEFTKEPSS